jgi:outer membrane protein assembly factor BamE
MRLLVTLLASLALAGCVYKIDVQQGNYVTQDVVAKLKKGMTKSEVKQLLGTPLLSDAFHANRWDYFFSNVKGGKPEDRTRLTVFFEEDKLVSVMGDVRPAAPSQVAPKAAAPTAPAPAPAPAKAAPAQAATPPPAPATK